MKQSGFTVVELFIVLSFVATLTLAGFAIWAAVHFILKFW